VPIRLVLADDHPLVLSGLEQLFAGQPEFLVLASCTDGEEALRAVRRHRPDILILDLKMPKADGLTVLRELRSEKLAVRVVVLTAALDEGEVLEAIRLGVRGVVLKDMATRQLIQCLHNVHAGEEWLEKRSVGRALEKILRRETELQALSKLLTAREVELLRLVAGGLNNKEIAAQLNITEGTVKVHLHSVYDKLKLKSRLALTLYAREKGLV
jgi:DNA-binding NarL/FixJ family response regulator